MPRIHRADGEVMGDFLHRATGILKVNLSHFNIQHETWDLHATQLRFDWGGHVARLEISDPSRRTFRVFQHWDYGMIVRKIDNQNNGR